MCCSREERSSLLRIRRGSGSHVDIGEVVQIGIGKTVIRTEVINGKLRLALSSLVEDFS
jgi:hypothetical protein